MLFLKDYMLSVFGNKLMQWYVILSLEPIYITIADDGHFQ